MTFGTATPEVVVVVDGGRVVVVVVVAVVEVAVEPAWRPGAGVELQLATTKGATAMRPPMAIVLGQDLMTAHMMACELALRGSRAQAGATPLGSDTLQSGFNCRSPPPLESLDRSRRRVPEAPNRHRHRSVHFVDQACSAA